MAAFSVTATDAVTAGGQTAGHITRGASTRAKVFEWTLSHSGTPADNAIFWSIKRHTSAPTSSSVTPAPLDSADPASTTTAGENATIEPTFGAIIWENAIYQRATYRWVAVPGSEVVIPDTANNGLAFVPSHASYTGNCEVTAYFTE